MIMQRSYRIMLASEPSFGSCARGMLAGFRRLGHETRSANYREIIPKVTTVPLKILRRGLIRWFVRDYNNYLLATSENFQPEIFMAVKGAYIRAETLRKLRRRGVRTYNFYPDVSVFAHDRYIPESLVEYDHIFSTKTFHKEDLGKRLGISNISYVPHGYDPDVYRPVELTDWDRARYEADVCFIASHTAKKESLVAAIARAIPGIKIKIWGNLWRQRCRSSELDSAIMGQPLEGTAYAKAIQASKISLGINSEVVPGSSFGDFMAQRSFEIPACGGFMLHERNEEVRRFYQEDQEVVLFDGPDELVEKVDYYLKHDDERKAIACAGHNRCVPAYSYDQRAAECLRLHEEMTGTC